MPTYSYRCKNCGAEFDQFQKFVEQPLTRCPTCRKNMLRRVFQPSAIVFKGKGWYATDNRSASGASAKSENGAKEGAEKPEKTEKAAESSNGEKAAKSETAATTDSKPAKKDSSPASSD